MAPFNLVLAVPWIPGFVLYMSRDAYLAARRSSSGVLDVKRRWQPCLVAACLLLPLSALLGHALEKYTPVRQGVVAGDAMAPTLVEGERILLDVNAHAGSLPDPGNIVYLEHPGNRDTSIIKRCIATAGQIVAIENGVVYVDGIRFDEPEGVQPVLEDFGPEVVPDGHLFVMGDDRRRSSDSRHWGAVPQDHLLGRAVQKLIARDARSGAIRLDRIGEVLD